eukprot:GHRR01006516.1.p2 GENE.GHRR01006516.1~~GHRR01006516.1.p2  ORF type:complete len:138 (-),score=33.79 GHRR01006516.1:1961-2374(-)
MLRPDPGSQQKHLHADCLNTHQCSCPVKLIGLAVHAWPESQASQLCAIHSTHNTHTMHFPETHAHIHTRAHTMTTCIPATPVQQPATCTPHTLQLLTCSSIVLLAQQLKDKSTASLHCSSYTHAIVTYIGKQCLKTC